MSTFYCNKVNICPNLSIVYLSKVENEIFIIYKIEIKNDLIAYQKYIYQKN